MVPTITFGVLYCFLVIRHDRRRILPFHVTWHPGTGRSGRFDPTEDPSGGLGSLKNGQRNTGRSGRALVYILYDGGIEDGQKW